MRYGYILRLASAQVAGNEIKIRKQIKTTEQKGMAVGGWLVVGGRLRFNVNLHFVVRRKLNLHFVFRRKLNPHFLMKLHFKVNLQLCWFKIKKSRP